MYKLAGHPQTVETICYELKTGEVGEGEVGEAGEAVTASDL